MHTCRENMSKQWRDTDRSDVDSKQVNCCFVCRVKWRKKITFNCDFVHTLPYPGGTHHVYQWEEKFHRHCRCRRFYLYVFYLSQESSLCLSEVKEGKRCSFNRKILKSTQMCF